MRRVAAIVLPRLACELARRREPPRSPVGPCGVIVTGDERQDVSPAADRGRRDDEHSSDAEAIPTATLAAVNEQAWRYGVRPGQAVAEATTFIGGLRIRQLASAELERALAKVAEVALSLGTTAATGLEQEGAGWVSHRDRAGQSVVGYPGGAGAGPADTVWLDISGCAHLRGGEDLLCEDLRERAKQLGHSARIAIADGPRIAQAVARWGKEELIVPQGRGAQALASLPIAALPLSSELLCWLGKLGIMRLGDLDRLDRAQLAARLGPRAQDLLGLLRGVDDVPLVSYEPARRIEEALSFDDEQEGLEPLLFVLGSMVSSAAVLLQARGEAASRVVVELSYDRSIARLRGIEEPAERLELELPIPLYVSEELLRTVRARLERVELGAPVRAIRLTLDGLSPASRRQLHLSRRARAGQQQLPTLLAELSAWLGPGRVGTLSWVDSLRPEAQSQLQQVALEHGPRAGEAKKHMASCNWQAATDGSAPPWLPAAQPTRLLSRPLPLGPLKAGELVSVEQAVFVIDQLQLHSRLDHVQWWTPAPLSRDYARAWLHSTKRGGVTDEEHSEAWVFVDRATGQGFIHGWFE